MTGQKLVRGMVALILVFIPVFSFSCNDGDIPESSAVYQFQNCTKYSENPIFPYGDNDWDYDKHFPSVIYNPDWPSATQYRMWYMGYGINMEVCTCYAYSADGHNWTKPHIGKYEYDGSTNNNIILALGIIQADVAYDSDIGKYVLLVCQDTTKTGTSHAVDIYTSSSPDACFTLQKSLPVSVGYPGIYHGFSIVERLDGRWCVYYQYRDTSNLRSIGAYLSDTADLHSDWTDLGVLIEHASANEQRYAIDVFIYNGKYYGALLNYSVATELTWIELWDSDDGQSWDFLDCWIDDGGACEWDSGILWQGNFVDLGDSWRFYYSGGQKTHAEYPQRKVAIGYIHGIEE